MIYALFTMFVCWCTAIQKQIAIGFMEGLTMNEKGKQMFLSGQTWVKALVFGFISTIRLQSLGFTKVTEVTPVKTWLIAMNVKMYFYCSIYVETDSQRCKDGICSVNLWGKTEDVFEISYTDHITQQIV